MKKLCFVFFLFAFVFGLECEAQFSANGHLVYGKPRTDGYQKITKGAFWSTRPEAKLIYEGARPEGYTVVILNEDCFVRFIDGEHNTNDKNYIIFPKGEVVYSDNKSGQLYAASCGNKIELVRPADFVIEVEKETVVEVKKSSQQSETTTGSHNVVDNGKPKPKPNLGNLNPTTKKEKKEIKIGKIVLRVGEGGLIVAAIAFIVKSLLNNHHHDGGEPGGAPVTPPVVVPPVVIPPAGGPGGAPTTP